MKVSLNLDQVDALCRIVELGSFTRAAGRLGITQATVSERIANLEQAVGARLLDRLGRRVEPTAVGRHLVERGRALLEAREALEVELDSLVRGRGTVRLGASTIPGEHILPALLARMPEATRPRVVVTIGDTAQIAEAVRTGGVEVGVVGAQLPADGLSYRPMWRDRMVLAVPRGHAFAGVDEVDPAALAGQPWVMREEGSGTRRSLGEAAGARIAAIDPVAVFSSPGAVKAAVIEGIGISVLSERAVRLEAAAGLLCAARIAGLSLDRRFFLVEDARRSRTPAATALIEHLLAHADAGIGSSDDSGPTTSE